MLRERASSTPKERLWLGAVVLIGAGIEIAGAAITRPFTWPADLVVGIPILVLAATAVAQRARWVSPLVVRRGSEDLGAERKHSRGRRWLLWIAPLVSVTIWELFSYAASPRSAHPTISSLLDSFDGQAWGRASAFGAWMALGCYLVTR